MEVPWVEKYRPLRLDQLKREKGTEAMKTWAKSWNDGIPEKRGLLLYGPPGTGKTSAAKALSLEMNWDYLEFNASDVRSKTAINETALKGSFYNTISEVKGGKKLIVLDEVDSLYERNIEGGDAGGKSAISNLLDRTLNPVVLIANNLYELRSGMTGKALVDKCEIIEFQRYRSIQILSVLREICREEQIYCSQDKLTEIAANSNGDMRAAINDLQGFGDYSGAQDRDVTQNIYNIMNELIFRRKPAREIRQEIINLGEDPDTFILYLLENVFPYHLDREEFVAALQNIARADLFLGRVGRRMNYSLWGYATDLMAETTIFELKGDKYLKFAFPSLIKRMGQLKKFRNIRDEFASKSGKYVHKSRAFMDRDSLKFIFQLLLKDEEIRANLEEKMRLDIDDVLSLDL